MIKYFIFFLSMFQGVVHGQEIVQEAPVADSVENSIQASIQASGLQDGPNSDYLLIQHQAFEPRGYYFGLAKGASAGVNSYRTDSDQLKFLFYPTPWFGFGGSYKRFQVYKSSLARRVEAEYKLEGLSVDQRLPLSSSYLEVRLRPLLGRWNILGQSVIDCAFGLGLGAGRRNFQFGTQSTSLSTAAGFEIFISNFQISLEQQMELDGIAGGSRNWSEFILSAGVYF